MRGWGISKLDMRVWVGEQIKGDDMANYLWLGFALHNLFYFKRCNTVETPVRDRQNATSDFAGT